MPCNQHPYPFSSWLTTDDVPEWKKPRRSRVCWRRPGVAAGARPVDAELKLGPSASLQGSAKPNHLTISAERGL
ncbi:unnamed protein product [Merluccius merluccius]